MKLQSKQKRRFRAGGLALLLGMLLLVPGCLLLWTLPDHCEYAFLPEKVSDESYEFTQQLTSLQTAMEGIPWTAAVRAQHAAVSSPLGASVLTTVYAVSAGYFEVRFHPLTAGYPISAQEVSDALPSAVISEQTAQALFPGMDPIGQTLSADDLTLTVTGVAKAAALGETDANLIWIPLSLADRSALTPASFEVIIPSVSAQVKAQARTALTAWRSGGTWHDSSRLRTAALLPLLAVGLLAGFFLWRMLLRFLFSLVQRRWQMAQDCLQHNYIKKAWGRLLLLFLPVLGVFALLLISAYGLLSLAAIPLYVFPDWIPETPVDPASIGATLQSLMTSSAAAAQYQTRLSTVAEWSRGLIIAGTLLALGGTALSVCSRRIRDTD